MVKTEGSNYRNLFDVNSLSIDNLLQTLGDAYSCRAFPKHLKVIDEEEGYIEKNVEWNYYIKTSYN